jgi:hypothetical protein
MTVKENSSSPLRAETAGAPEQQKAEHTPLPWKVIENVNGGYGPPDVSAQLVYSDDGFVVAAVMSDVPLLQRAGNADFIVRACNTHDELVAALREMIADSDDVDDGKLPAIAAVTLVRARSLLAKLES